ncbi:MAG: glycosyltransferase family 2 protein [Candidatus Thorarchaeota archaeon]
MKSIDICMPIWRAPIDPQIVCSIASLLKMKEYDVNLIVERGFQAAEARNKLVEKSKADYLFFMDSDSLVTPQDLKQLVEDDKDIVSGVYFMRGMPYNPVIYKTCWQGGFKFLHDVGDGLERIDGCGMGCCLIKRHVFEKVRSPWFEFNMLGNGSTEDFDFCRKASQEGFQLWADWRIKIGHVGSYVFSYGDWKRMQDNQKKIETMGVEKREIKRKPANKKDS